MSTAAQPVDACAICPDLSGLSEYNLFVRENYSGGHNVQGKVAARGNITLSGFSIGVGVPVAPLANVLVAGGTLKLTQGSVFGNARYGVGYEPDSVGYERGGTVEQQEDLDDFLDARIENMLELSTRLANKPVTGTIEREFWGKVTLKGLDSCLNVFSLDASEFVRAPVRVLDVPPGSFVVINLYGTPPAFGGGGLGFEGGINSRRLLYHFVDATTLQAIGTQQIVGTTLAPQAAVTLIDSGWVGSLYARSLTGDRAGVELNPLEEVGGAVECHEGETASCTTICGSTGSKVCGDSCTWGACTPPATETCNGVDDTCNGQVDEGFECTGSGSRACTASCGAPGTESCNPATCTYGACISSSCCQADGDCAAGFYCEGDRCAARRGPGDTCTADTQCLRGPCVDGRCCDTACAGACDSCAQPGSEGTCLPLPGGSAGAPSCAPYLCAGEAATCPSQCTVDSACAEGHYCAGGTCAPTLRNGDACSADNQCTDGHCVDSVCCNSACEGACDACDLEGSRGTCSLSPPEVECRGVAVGNSCDVAEFCTGASASCPADGFLEAGEACASDSNACTVDECNATGSCMNSPVLPGSTCGDGQVCNAEGECMADCWIGEVPYEPGATRPGEACQVCDPSQSTSSWSHVADGTSCGTSQGEWGSCGGFDDYCDTTGTRSRTVTASTCGAGMCSATSTSLEQGECTREAPNTSCAAPSYGEWGACTASETCALTGRKSRTVTSYGYSCATGQCVASISTEEVDCTRDTDGVECRQGGTCDVAEYCSNGSCPPNQWASPGSPCSDDDTCTVGDTCNGSGVCNPGQTPTCQAPTETYGNCGGFDPNDPCDQTGTRSRTRTAYSYDCGLGRCVPTVTVDDVDCLRNTNGALCRAGGTCDVAEYCSGGSCPIDAKALAGSPCNADSNVCTVNDSCNGSGSCTQGPPMSCPASSETVSACTGFSEPCGNVGSRVRTRKTYSCSNSQGGCRETISNITETCTRPSRDGVQCRAGGTCDVAEYCSGGSCPGDAKAPAGSPCNADSNVCTVNDSCNGSGSCTQGPLMTCPAPSETVSECTGFSGTCDNTGTRVRTRKTYSCSNSQGGCAETISNITETCTRPSSSVPACQSLEGTSCITPGASQGCCDGEDLGYCNCAPSGRTHSWYCI